MVVKGHGGGGEVACAHGVRASSARGGGRRLRQGMAGLCSGVHVQRARDVVSWTRQWRNGGSGRCTRCLAHGMAMRGSGGGHEQRLGRQGRAAARPRRCGFGCHGVAMAWLGAQCGSHVRGRRGSGGACTCAACVSLWRDHGEEGSCTRTGDGFLRPIYSRVHRRRSHTSATAQGWSKAKSWWPTGRVVDDGGGAMSRRSRGESMQGRGERGR
jgi:hypothetical protein